MENKKIVLGAGVIGLFTAYYLHKSGVKDILVIDQNKKPDGCSFGNAGMIVPSHFIPLASPGMITKGIRWMFDSKSPFYLKPRLGLDLMRWGYGFYKSSNTKHVNTAAPILRDLSFLAKKLYGEINKEDIGDFDYQDKGLLLYCNTDHALKEEIEVSHMANDLGIKTEILNNTDKLNTGVAFKGAGAVYYPGDAHLNPSKLMSVLHDYLVKNGVEIKYETTFKKAIFEKNKVKEIQVEHNKNLENVSVSDVFICTGAWSETMAKHFGNTLPMQAGKGYSFMVDQHKDAHIDTPSIFVEARVAISPFSTGKVRFGGTMEIAGLNDKINMNRVKGISSAIPKYFTSLKEPNVKESEVWYGLRPCSPDGMPYVGRSKDTQNLFFNTGHAMMGISLAPGSAKVISEIYMGEKLSVSIDILKPERFS